MLFLKFLCHSKGPRYSQGTLWRNKKNTGGLVLHDIRVGMKLASRTKVFGTKIDK